MIALKKEIGSLNPAYFAMVMATGIVSIALQFSGMPLLAQILFWLNVGLYLWLASLYLVRLFLATDRVILDLKDHNRGVGFFTIVAGTCVLGSQFVLILEDERVAKVLWLLGIVLWAVLLYTVFTHLTVKPHKPKLEEGLNGGWLLSVVATQSVSVLGNLIVLAQTSYQDEILFFCLVMWLGGGMLYIWIMSLIFYRYTFFILEPAHLSPPYWINMGAMAIATLAGAGLILNAPNFTLLQDLLPFLKGFTLFFWATATMWIPMLLILGVWRHIIRRFPLKYDPAYWGAVFPLGMYTVCTYRLIDAIDLPFLLFIPQYGVYIAATAWLATGFGLMTHLFGMTFKKGQA